MKRGEGGGRWCQRKEQMFAKHTQMIIERASDGRGKKGGVQRQRGGGVIRWVEARAWGFTCRYTLAHQCGYLRGHLSVPPRLTGCLHIVFEELHHLLNTLLPLSLYPCPNPSIHPSIHPAVQTSTQAWPGVTVPTDERGWWEMEGEGMPWGKEGWRRDARTRWLCCCIVMLCSRCKIYACESIYNTHSNTWCMQITRLTRHKKRGSL